MTYTIAALYHFTKFEDTAAIRTPLLAQCEEVGIKGTLLLAREGINGTIAGSENAIAQIIGYIRTIPGCADIVVKYSSAETEPFAKMKVKLKREIVTMGEPDIDPNLSVGHYVDPHDWNALISDPNTIVIDTRNTYEVATGKFKGAIDPLTETFREFPAWFRAEREKLLAQGTDPNHPPKVAMYCTGGIRCEKSTSFLRAEGIDEVYHLKGGILKYLEEVPAEESLWEGECFVFDERVTVRHGLEPGDYHLCRACRMPIDANDMASDAYEEGISCPHCIDKRDDKQRQRYIERQKQRMLEKERAAKAAQKAAQKAA